MIVLDANILIRAVLARRVRELLDTYAPRGVRFFAPDVAFDDAEKYLPPLLARRGKPVADVASALAYLRTVIEPVTSELYAIFESEGRERLQDRDENDWPVLATALALSCAIWTEDPDFFGTGAAVWTTNRIEIFFKEQLKAIESTTSPECDQASSG
jgi:predicted nucleic acid-binding protein